MGVVVLAVPPAVEAAAAVRRQRQQRPASRDFVKFLFCRVHEGRNGREAASMYLMWAVYLMEQKEKGRRDGACVVWEAILDV